MRQLILELLPEAAPSLDNFVAGGNGEALAGLARWLSPENREPSVYVWGETSAGKSHLLRACGATYHDAEAAPTLTCADAEHPFHAVDNVQALDAEGQIALFNLFNRLRATGGRLLTAGDQPPLQLRLREDLRTRLGSGLIYRLQPLSDAEKAAALGAQAKDRALKLSPEAIDYLMRHAPRDMRTLSAFIVALDRYTLEHKRAVTLPLLRELLAETLPLDFAK